MNATADASQNLTAAGAIVGTPAYLAPEQARGEDLDPRADVFAAAAVLHEMLAGSPPFRRATVADTIAAILFEPPGSLPPEAACLEPLVRRGLAKRREERPASAAVFRGQLARALTGGPSTPSPPPGDALTLVLRPPSSQVAAPAASLPRRLAVLPFRLLKPDPEHDFLAFGLADAVATSLTSGGGLLVRPPLTTQSFAGGVPDLAETRGG
jgi:serine/threonine-protein kinase